MCQMVERKFPTYYVNSKGVYSLSFACLDLKPLVSTVFSEGQQDTSSPIPMAFISRKVCKAGSFPIA